MIRKILIVFFICMCIPICVYSTDAILESQQETLNIKGFISEANKYTEDVFVGINFSNFFKDAMKGNINNETILKSVLSLLGKEVIQTIRVMGSIIVIIVVHSILKSVSEGLENKAIGQITYYVQYILIVTLVMSNFASVVSLTKEAINNLVGFSYTLLPILTTLMITTGV